MYIRPGVLAAVDQRSRDGANTNLLRAGKRLWGEIMYDKQYDQIITLWKQLRKEPDAKEQIAKRTKIGLSRVKAIIGQHENKNARSLVKYKIMKKKRQGLRLVRITAGNNVMDWYTDKDEKAIEWQCDLIRRRMTGETA